MLHTTLKRRSRKTALGWRVRVPRGPFPQAGFTGHEGNLPEGVSEQLSGVWAHVAWVRQTENIPKHYNRSVFQPFGSNAASFTDDTSLPYAPLHVSIHAQIIKEDTHNWYFHLRHLALNGQAEFKEQATRMFFGLPESNRDKIFRSLRRARIHITDPRPYAIDLGENLRNLLPKGTNICGFLRRLDSTTKHLAAVQGLTRMFVIDSIMDDSPARHLLMRYRAWQYSTGQRIPSWWLPQVGQAPSQVDANEIAGQYKPKAVTEAANFISASASVFTPAIDRFDEAYDDPFLSAPMAGSYLLNRALAAAHAFDAGNEQIIKGIEEQRSIVLDKIDENRFFYPHFMPEPLGVRPRNLVDCGVKLSTSIRCALS